MACNCGGGKKFSGTIKTTQAGRVQRVESGANVVQSSSLRAGSLTGSVPLKRTTV